MYLYKKIKYFLTLKQKILYIPVYYVYKYFIIIEPTRALAYRQFRPRVVSRSSASHTYQRQCQIEIFQHMVLAIFTIVLILIDSRIDGIHGSRYHGCVLTCFAAE